MSSNRKPKILLIDDDRDFQNKHKYRFRKEYDWISAYSEEDVLRALDAKEYEFDLALLDLKLCQDGSDEDFEGINLRRNLTEHQIPFMVLTQSPITRNVEKFFQQDGVDVIRKEWLANADNFPPFIEKIEERRIRRRIVSVYSSTREDHQCYIDLSKQLYDLEKKGYLWSEDGNGKNDPGLSGGSDIEQERLRQLKEAGVILLFISPDLFHQDRFDEYSECYRRIRQSSRARRLIVPILHRQFDWRMISFGGEVLGKFHTLPTNNQFIIDLVNGDNREAVLRRVADGIRRHYGKRPLH